MEILNVASEVNDWGLVALFVAIFGLVICSIYIENYHLIGSIISGLICICGVIVLILCCTVWKIPTYEVLIKDDISYEYMLENYEVVKQRGKIWEIRKKK